MGSFIAELRRRNVVRAGAFYAAAGWLLVQVTTQVFPFYNIPNWAVRWVIAALAIGFPFWLAVAWFYEFTPEGLKRENEVAPGESITRKTGRKLDLWIIGILAVAVVLLLTDRFVLHRNANDIAAAPDKSIAVLPFANLSEDKANAYFAAGIQDEVLTRLAKIGALKVISRTSTQHYASSPGNLPQIAKELGVANILEGSVQKTSDSVRINVQLIRADGDSHLWAETYDRKLTDIFGVESEVATAIAGSLQAQLTGSEQRALAVKPTENAAAYDAYLRGLALEASGYSYDTGRQATAAYAEAVGLDPRFALAWAHLAVSRSYLYFNGIDLGENALDSVKQAADAALREQPELGEAWLAQGYYRYRGLRDYPGALQAFGEARKRLPNSAQVLAAFALVQRRMGRWEDGLANMQQAVQLDPRNLTLIDSLAGEYLAPMRRFSEARAVLDRALLIAPGRTQFIGAKAQTYVAEGRLDEAAQLLDPLPLDPKDDAVFGAKLNLLFAQHRFDAVIAALQPALPKPGAPLTDQQVFAANGLGLIELWAGHTAAARPWFERVIHTLKPETASAVRVDNSSMPAELAKAYAGIGDKQEALDAARKAVELYGDDAVQKPQAEITLAQIQANFGDIDAAIAALPHLLQVPNGLNPTDLQVDPSWNPLRKDARFQKLIAGSGTQRSRNPCARPVAGQVVPKNPRSQAHFGE
jgi:TolB-like protein/Flp pilus assembly protein TadD